MFPGSAKPFHIRSIIYCNDPTTRADNVTFAICAASSGLTFDEIGMTANCVSSSVATKKVFSKWIGKSSLRELFEEARMAGLF